MNTNSKKTYLSIAISSILYASTAMNANADSCTDYTVTDICEQSKYGAGEFHNIKLGDGVTAGSEDHHFVFNGEGYELYNSNANFSAQIASGTIRYTEVNNSHFTVNAHHFPDDTIYAGRAENTTLNDSLMWVATSADQTLAKGNSMVVVSTQMAMVDQIFVTTLNDGSLPFDPVITNSRYEDTSYEMLWGMKNEAKGWDTKATSHDSVFVDASKQSIEANGHSIGATFYDRATQVVKAGGESQDTHLFDHSYSWVYAEAKLTGLTEVNDAATVYMNAAATQGAYAENVVLNGEDTTLMVRASLDNNAYATVDNLILNGGEVVFQQSSGDQYASLNIGTLSGSGSFLFNTSIAEGKGNFVTIANASGEHKVIVNDSGHEITSPDMTTLDLIHDLSGDATFTLASISGANIIEVDGGTYVYSLNTWDNSARAGGNLWYLGSGLNTGTELEPEPEEKTTPSTDAVLSMASSNQFIFDGEMQNLRFRKGDLNNNKGDGASVWGRYLTNNTRVNAAHDAAYRLQQDGFEIGADKVLEMSSGQLVLGGFTSYSNNRVKHARGGNSTVDSYSLGAYGTYFDNSGYYVDAVVKANRFKNSLNAHMTNGGSVQSDYNQNAIGGSLEAGYHYSLSNNWFVEPYVRTSYYTAQDKDIALNNGMTANIDNNRSAKGEIGTHLGTKIDLNNGAIIRPYAKVAIEREFIKSNTVTINQVNDFNNDLSGHTAKYGLGMDINLTKQTSVYAEANYRNGTHVESPIMANIGFRINF